MKAFDTIDFKDERTRVRLESHARIEIKTVDQRILHGYLRNIAIDSLFMDSDHTNQDFLILDEKVHVQITIPAGNSSLSITCNAHIARLDGTGVALKFTSPLKWWPVLAMISSTGSSPKVGLKQVCN